MGSAAYASAIARSAATPEALPGAPSSTTGLPDGAGLAPQRS